MFKDTSYTKRKLAFSFSFIVFGIVFFLSLTFFILVYLGINHQHFSDFTMFTKAFKNGKITLEDITNLGEKFENDHENKKLGKLNYIILDENNNIKLKFLTSNFTQDEIDKIIYNNISEIYNVGGFLVKNIIQGDKKIILIDENTYSLEELFTNILVLFLIALFSEIIVFFLSKRFVNKLFIPVETNISNMNDFIHNAGHELQTPLSVIVSDIDFYKKSSKKDPEILEEIKAEAKKMGTLIKSLLKLSKKERDFSKEEIKVKDFIDSIVNSYNSEIKKKNINIILNIPKNAFVNVNKEHLYICLSNIFSNAIKYNKDAGEIKISYFEKTFTIKDAGVGIKQENLKNIFSRFYKEDISRNSSGFGIGLSLVRKLCKENKWTIKAESEEGKGSSFSLIV